MRLFSRLRKHLLKFMAVQGTSWGIISVPREASEMFQMKPYGDKSNVVGLFIHSFVSYERIQKWDEERYRKSGIEIFFEEY